MIDLIAGILILVGSIFALIAGIGLLRLPDFYLRIHAATKAGTLAAGLVLIAVAVEAQMLEITARAISGLLFLFITAPIAAHLLGRAGYIAGVPLWKNTGIDDLKGKYDPETNELAGNQPKRPPDRPHERVVDQ